MLFLSKVSINNEIKSDRLFIIKYFDVWLQNLLNWSCRTNTKQLIEKFFHSLILEYIVQLSIFFTFFNFLIFLVFDRWTCNKFGCTLGLERFHASRGFGSCQDNVIFCQEKMRITFENKRIFSSNHIMQLMFRVIISK